MLLCLFSGIAFFLDCLSVPYHKVEAPKNIRLIGIIICYILSYILIEFYKIQNYLAGDFQILKSYLRSLMMVAWEKRGETVVPARRS
jgi:hypothetical protein